MSITLQTIGEIQSLAKEKGIQLTKDNSLHSNSVEAWKISSSSLSTCFISPFASICPTSLLALIFRFLNFNEHFPILTVNHYWYNIALTKESWLGVNADNLFKCNSDRIFPFIQPNSFLTLLPSITLDMDSAFKHANRLYRLICLRTLTLKFSGGPKNSLVSEASFIKDVYPYLSILLRNKGLPLLHLITVKLHSKYLEIAEILLEFSLYVDVEIHLFLASKQDYLMKFYKKGIARLVKTIRLSTPIQIQNFTKHRTLPISPTELSHSEEKEEVKDEEELIVQGSPKTKKIERISELTSPYAAVEKLILLDRAFPLPSSFSQDLRITFPSLTSLYCASCLNSTILSTFSTVISLTRINVQLDSDCSVTDFTRFLSLSPHLTTVTVHSDRTPCILDMTALLENTSVPLSLTTLKCGYGIGLRTPVRLVAEIVVRLPHLSTVMLQWPPLIDVDQIKDFFSFLFSLPAVTSLTIKSDSSLWQLNLPSSIALLDFIRCRRKGNNRLRYLHIRCQDELTEQLKECGGPGFIVKSQPKMVSSSAAAGPT